MRQSASWRASARVARKKRPRTLMFVLRHVYAGRARQSRVPQSTPRTHLRNPAASRYDMCLPEDHLATVANMANANTIASRNTQPYRAQALVLSNVPVEVK